MSLYSINHLLLQAIKLSDDFAGTVQENGVPSTMGAPLMLTHNSSNNNNNNHRTSRHSLDNNLSDEHFDMLDTERDNSNSTTAVNGKLDINIKDNSIRDKTDNKAQYYSSSLNDLKRNYH